MATDIGDRVRAAFAENLNLKLLSLAFALLLYSLVHGAQEAQRSFLVSLVVTVPPMSANRELMSPMPPQVRITVRGPRPVLDDLRTEDIGNMQIDVRAGTEKRIFFEPQMVHVPAGLHVEQFEPAMIDLQWEDRITRDLPVQVSVVGTPAPGFVVSGNVAAEPQNVRIRGPQSEIAALPHVRAEAFDVQGLTEGKYPRMLVLDRPRGRAVLDVPSVQATATVTRAVTERGFKKIPVQVVGPPKGRSEPKDVDVSVVCPPEVVNSLSPEHVIAKVEVTAKEPTGSASLPVSLALDDRCKARVNPPQVVVRW